MTPSTNLLANETSPYLQQHARNPVEWYPWGEQALTKAREEDKPILLSIGYSACHWCHVMAHESFEDDQTARVMNELYVNIKIDREERPDLDKIYQTAQALLTQRTGGWPLTMFLTPQDRVPFFGGTYFPNEPRHGLPAFKDLLRRVEQYYRGHRDEIERQNVSMINALDQIYGCTPNTTPLNPDITAQAQHELEQSFDARHGGFGRAPKFPHPTNLDFLLRTWATSASQSHPDSRALHLVSFTLEKMAAGGIYDHLGGGFCRYSVDDLWMIPHFEKMLYDNGPLLTLYSEAACATGQTLFKRTAIETADWVKREMQSPEGGYYSTLDADSEGREGQYYIWQPQELKALLDVGDYALFARRFGLDRAANFEGRWHLHTFVETAQLAKEFNLSETEVQTRLDELRRRLFARREQRVRPGRDEKILTSWNGLMIKGMVAAGRYFGNQRYIESATYALDFIQSTLWNGKQLLATYKDGKAHLNAYLDDYAFLIDGILGLLQARWRHRDLALARELAKVLLNRFEDRNHGGFYFTSDDHEQLIQRPKVFADEATPSGNGVAATVLARLGHLLGDTRYLDAAERTLKQAAQAMHTSPMGHASLLNAYRDQLEPPQIVILRGHGEALEKWRELSVKDYAPRRFTLAIPDDAQELPESLADKAPRGETVAYVCQNMTCSPPITEQHELESRLAETTVKI
jgi:uncharacterized protein YyaL (SSP411 family)